jgi:predicted AlkP superfamily phosphohydrolase/phosphomutase
MDWTRTRAFATTPTSNGIYITSLAAGSRSEYVALRERLTDDLMRLRHPETDERIVERIHAREEAFAGPFGTMAPDLTLELHDGGLVSILPSERIVSERPSVAGAHRPVGIFLAAGPGIRSGWTAPPLSILDVAPITLYGLGLDVVEGMEGDVPHSVFEPSLLEQRPVRRTAAVPAAGSATEPVAVLDAEQEAIVMRRLQELGYVE